MMGAMRLLPLTLIAVAAPALAQVPPPDETPPPEEAAPAAETPPPTIPNAEPPAAEPAGTVKYDKGFVLGFGEDFELKIVGRVQARYELFNRENSEPGLGKLQERFLIARGRVTLEGHAFRHTGFKFQTEFGRGFVFLRDYYLDQDFGGIHVRAGQWKRPYSRQQITSSGNLQMVDRSITDRFGNASRDVGVVVHNDYEKTKDGIEWAVGVFNGTGDRPVFLCEVVDPMMPAEVACEETNVPPDIGPMAVVHLGYNLGGIKGYSESDLEGGPFRFAGAVSYLADLAQGKSDNMIHRVAVDALVKVHGFSVTAGAYIVNQDDGTGMGKKATDVGWHGQAGYMVLPKTIELAARMAIVPVGPDDQIEALGGFNWFFQGHALKWQTDAGVIHTGSDPTVTDVQIRTQAQLIF
jgi:hypothetical protein